MALSSIKYQAPLSSNNETIQSTIEGERWFFVIRLHLPIYPVFAIDKRLAPRGF
jgi:hypothetical protein